MYNKKGTAFEEFVGLGAFSFAVLIGLLFLFGCRVYEKTQDYEEFEFSKEELEATKALNAFLGMPVDEERNVIDLIIESVNNGDYADLNTAAVNHFSGTYDYWLLEIIGYDSIDYNDYVGMTGMAFIPPLPEVKTKIYGLRDNIELNELEITLKVHKAYI